MEKEEDMSWIDIYLSDGEPDKVYGADAQQALTSMLRMRDLPYLWIRYRKAGVKITDTFLFIIFDIIRTIAYRRGFESGYEYYKEELQDEK